jgi:hypothetical protein
LGQCEPTRLWERTDAIDIKFRVGQGKVVTFAMAGKEPLKLEGVWDERQMMVMYYDEPMAISNL